jgi:hypothetical protein
MEVSQTLTRKYPIAKGSLMRKRFNSFLTNSQHQELSLIKEICQDSKLVIVKERDLLMIGLAQCNQTTKKKVVV